MIRQIFSAICSTAFLHQAVSISVPYVLAALGGTLCELGGVVNIALEGLILMGAFGAVMGTYLAGNPNVGLLTGIAAGMFFAWIHGLVSIRYRADQIISGLAINMLAVGITKFFLKTVFRSSSNSARIVGLSHFSFGALSAVPVLGDIVSHPLILLTVLLVFGTHILVYKTPFGLRLRAAGEHPECADTLGIRVHRIRYIGVLLSGTFAALGGAWLAFDQHQFTDNMSGGRGYIALTAMIFGKWTPIGAAGAAILFGAAEAMQIQLQTVGVQVPTQFIQMIPYVLTLIVLAGAIGRAKAPAADGKPYPEE